VNGNWQLAWVRGRLVPRWIVERVSGQRPPHVRVFFVATPADEIETVSRVLGEALGHDWTIETTALATLEPTPQRALPFDLVWALSFPTQFAWEDRMSLLSMLARSLAPGGCIIVAPDESAAYGAGLSPCSSPGVFLSYAWAEPLQPAAREPPATDEGIRSDREIRELERENVLRALDKTDWKIAGKEGAAALLGIHPSTLRDRMRAFGIARRR
jgi:hypothetical protein